MSSFLSDNQGGAGGSKAQIFENAITRLRAKDSTVEIVYPSQHWPTFLASPDYAGTSSVAVLDSSFNPPTRAHLALALAGISESIPSSSGPIAILLLLSVRNADKQVKPGDASHAQRLQMMTLLAQEIERILSAQKKNDGDQTTTSSREHASKPSVAVAAIDEPTFVGKSSILIDYLSKSLVKVASPPSASVPRLTFILGWDTIVRFFDPKYYPSPSAMSVALHTFFEKEGSTILCARRPDPGAANAGGEPQRDDQERTFFASENVRSHVESNPSAVRMIDIGAEEVTVSSTLVRKGVAAGNGHDNGGWRGMMVASVAEFITAQQLYTASDVKVS